MIVGLQRKMVASRALDRSVGRLFARSFVRWFVRSRMAGSRPAAVTNEAQFDLYDGDGDGDGCRPHLLSLAVMSLVSLSVRFWFRGVMRAAF